MTRWRDVELGANATASDARCGKGAANILAHEVHERCFTSGRVKRALDVSIAPLGRRKDTEVCHLLQFGSGHAHWRCTPRYCTVYNCRGRGHKQCMHTVVHPVEDLASGDPRPTTSPWTLVVVARVHHGLGWVGWAAGRCWLVGHGLWCALLLPPSAGSHALCFWSLIANTCEIRDCT